jgi:hypothetical protein
MNFALQSISFILRRLLYHAVKSYNMGPMALLPSERKRAVDFLLLLKLHRPRLGLNPRTLGPVASTLTTRLSRMNLSLSYQYGQLKILKQRAKFSYKF